MFKFYTCMKNLYCQQYTVLSIRNKICLANYCFYFNVLDSNVLLMQVASSSLSSIKVSIDLTPLPAMYFTTCNSFTMLSPSLNPFCCLQVAGSWSRNSVSISSWSKKLCNDFVANSSRPCVVISWGFALCAGKRFDGSKAPSQFF